MKCLNFQSPSPSNVFIFQRLVIDFLAEIKISNSFYDIFGKLVSFADHNDQVIEHQIQKISFIDDIDDCREINQKSKMVVDWNSAYELP